ncbi:hypothetical protein V494_05525 [Pseudogymnoascus sp. VKM F-4513 (FW-928)]|nr:hypothetical protein V494_05525 [Pseudogymnoascus sp. VKM F-4513 (FW-928)]
MSYSSSETLEQCYRAAKVDGLFLKRHFDHLLGDLPQQATNKHKIWDRFFTPRLTSNFGLQRVKNMAYRLTETYAVSMAQFPGDFSTGNCGGLAPGVEACLKSVPDMDYLVTDKPNPRGELLIRSNVRFREYYKNPEETTKATDADRWFSTGDISERIENVYLANSSILDQAFVHGDSTQAFLVAILGIDTVTFAPYAADILKKSIDPTDLAAVKAAAAESKVRAAVVRDLDNIGKKNKFNSYEKVKAVHLELEPFTIENELLTPTITQAPSSSEEVPRPLTPLVRGGAGGADAKREVVDRRARET